MNYVAVPGFKRGVNNMVATVSSKQGKAEEIIDLVERYFGYTITLLRSKTRKHEICYARQVLMYMLSIKTNLTLKSIGEMLGGRDHTTVIHTKALIRDLMETDERIRKEIIELLCQI